MAVTDLALLTASPGELKRRPDGARYHDGETIITHLNRCLTPAGWSWTTGSYGYDELADQVWVLGTLTVRIVVEAVDGSEVTLETSHSERGWWAVKRKRSDDSFVDLGNDYKAADTDALKRAARLVGVGLDAWAKSQPAAAPQRQQSTQSPRPTTNGTAKPEPLPVSLSPAARVSALSRYVDLLAQARDRDFRASWTAQDPARWSDAQLGKYTGLLENYVSSRAVAV